jgi:hypothetical protein
MTDLTPRSLMLIETVSDSHIHLIYGEHLGDPRPIIVTVTPEYVAHKTSKPLPIRWTEFAHCLVDNAEDLRKIAQDCRDRGKTSAILTGTAMKEPKRSSKSVIGGVNLEESLKACARYVKMLRGGQPSEVSKAKAP